MQKLRLCREPECWNYFKPRNHCHIYCGSAKLKIGCAYKNRLRLNAKWIQTNPETMRRIVRNYWERNKDRINPLRRTKDYYFRVKLSRHRKYKREKLGNLVKKVN